ncbi:MAG: hypothetical protein JWP67_2362 [Mucilaginibacter sp.]|nr:hypothetical protein [Mucilaginibacter sp.]
MHDRFAYDEIAASFHSPTAMTLLEDILILSRLIIFIPVLYRR